MLTVQNLHVSRGGKAVLHGIDLAVTEGKITALLGANGAGKSSTVLAMGGAIPAERGSIQLGGKNIFGLRAEAVRAQGLAIVPEGHRVLGGLSVRDNLLAAATLLPRAEVAAAMDRVYGVFPELAEKQATLGRSLSGGQKQMVCMGQALLRLPRVLVIDELSLGLAPLVVKRLAEVVKDVARQGVGVLLIEQFTSLALSIASDACVLERGRVVYSGTAAELQAHPEILHSSYLARSTEA